MTIAFPLEENPTGWKTATQSVPKYLRKGSSMRDLLHSFAAAGSEMRTVVPPASEPHCQKPCASRRRCPLGDQSTRSMLFPSTPGEGSTTRTGRKFWLLGPATNNLDVFWHSGLAAFVALEATASLSAYAR